MFVCYQNISWTRITESAHWVDIHNWLTFEVKMAATANWPELKCPYLRQFDQHDVSV